MEIAKEIDGDLISQDYKIMFPLPVFPESGPNDEFMAENNCWHVSKFKPHDRLIENLIDAENYIEDNICYKVDAVKKTTDELIATVNSEKIKKLSALADFRWGIETGGINVAGSIVRTDRESQAQLSGAWIRAQIIPTVLIDFKSPAGWIQINKAQVEVIAEAVSGHVQACFTREKLHSDAIEALSDSAIAAINNNDDNLRDAITAILDYDFAELWSALG